MPTCYRQSRSFGSDLRGYVITQEAQTLTHWCYLPASKSKGPFAEHQMELGDCGMRVAWCCLAIWLGHRNHREGGIHAHRKIILFINTGTHTSTQI